MGAIPAKWLQFLSYAIADPADIVFQQPRLVTSTMKFPQVSEASDLF
jgi:hypothetical protein